MTPRPLRANGPGRKHRAHIDTGRGIAACGRSLKGHFQVTYPRLYVVCQECERLQAAGKVRLPQVAVLPIRPDVRGAVDRRCDDQLKGPRRICRCVNLTAGQNSQAHRYGVCRAVLAAWIAAGLCQCCGRGLGASWVIDHCHTSGFARGIVCRRCNIALAYIEDDELVVQARAYLGGAGRTRTDDLTDYESAALTG